MALITQTVHLEKNGMTACNQSGVLISSTRSTKDRNKVTCRACVVQTVIEVVQQHKPFASETKIMRTPQEASEFRQIVLNLLNNTASSMTLAIGGSITVEQAIEQANKIWNASLGTSVRAVSGTTSST